MNLQYLNIYFRCKSVLRNKLVFIAHICYFLFVKTTTSFVKMSIGRQLRDGFGGAAAGIALLAMPMAANAGDAPTTTTVASISTDVPTQEITRKEAFRASTNQIVYHVGEGIVGVDADVLALQRLGYKASAFFGGKAGEVECWLARLPCGKYDQDKVFDGTMSGIASLMYDDRFGEPTKSRQVAVLDR